MKQHPLDAEPSAEVERLVEALRSDLPSANDAARVRSRLIAAGVLAAGFGSSAAAAAAAKSSPPGLLSKVAALPVAVKVGAGGGLIALALSTAPVLEQRWKETRGAAQHQQQKAGAVLSAAQVTTNLVKHPETELELRATLPVIAPVPSGPLKIEPSPSLVGFRVSKALQVPAVQVGTSSRSGRDDARASEARVAAAAAETPAMNASLLNEETPLISRALQALKVGNLAAAREALNEHERRFPSGLLSPERERTRAKLFP